MRTILIGEPMMAKLPETFVDPGFPGVQIVSRQLRPEKVEREVHWLYPGDLAREENIFFLKPYLDVWDEVHIEKESPKIWDGQGEKEEKMKKLFLNKNLGFTNF